jgi:hemolysin D
MLPNRDVGFVHAGQAAEIKVEAFTYTRYGLLHGKIDGVSRDTLQNNGNAASSNKHSDNDPSTPPDAADGAPEDSNYVARVSLADTGVETEDGWKQLEPGMRVPAEIKTGQRRVISYLLSPLLRYRQEGLRER